MGTVSEECISNIRTVKAFSTEKYEGERHMIANAECYNNGVQLAKYNALFTFFV